MAEHHYVERTKSNRDRVGEILGVFVGIVVIAVLVSSLVMPGRFGGSQSLGAPSVPQQTQTSVNPRIGASWDKIPAYVDLQNYSLEELDELEAKIHEFRRIKANAKG